MTNVMLQSHMCTMGKRCSAHAGTFVMNRNRSLHSTSKARNSFMMASSIDGAQLALYTGPTPNGLGLPI